MKWHSAIFVAVCLPLLLLPVRLVAQDDESSSAPQSKRDKSTDSARETEMSSSKDTRIDLTPPKDDAKNHPNSTTITDSDSDTQDSASDDVDEMHPWDPHKAAKDIEVGDYYFKRKNYRGALERYKDALTYKPNDAVANFRMAQCDEKLGNSSDAVQHYQAYLSILPHGPFAGEAQESLNRLKSTARK
jgi:tetratricopeptide (TPR) repeat protein